MHYKGWMHGEPNNYDGHENCLEILYDIWADDYGWNDNNCERKLNFVCEK